jgi:hypothetical protein
MAIAAPEPHGSQRDDESPQDQALNPASSPGTLDHEDGKPLDNPAGRFPAGIAGRPGNARLAAILRARATGKYFT